MYIYAYIYARVCVYIDNLIQMPCLDCKKIVYMYVCIHIYKFTHTKVEAGATSFHHQVS